jgi:hypothetical protein
LIVASCGIALRRRLAPPGSAWDAEPPTCRLLVLLLWTSSQRDCAFNAGFKVAYSGRTWVPRLGGGFSQSADDGDGQMSEGILKAFDQPDEVREFPFGRFEIVHIAGVTLERATYEPGWKWSVHDAPSAGTQLCRFIPASLPCGMAMPLPTPVELSRPRIVSKISRSGMPIIDAARSARSCSSCFYPGSPLEFPPCGAYGRP